ncbi:MAG: PilZ domain-containing protein [Deltaproteobacteria bacterium]|nr:PilZ domain-containing protein [Deltaproteobacteria bacterium]
MQVHRRFTRHPITLTVWLMVSGRWLEFQTTDISRPGMFVRVLTPTHQVGQALQVRLRMPDGTIFEGMVQVRRVVPATHFNPLGAGLGLEWFALSTDSKNRWDNLVFGMRRQTERQSYAENSQDLRSQLPPENVRAMLRKMREAGELAAAPREVPHPEARAPLVVPVSPANQERLEAVAMRCGQQAHLFLKTDRPPVLGQHVRIMLTHPDTDVEFVVRAIVERIVTGEDDLYAGMQVRCLPMTAQEREELGEFVAGQHALA